MAETLPLVKEAGYPGVLIIGEPDYYPKVGFVRCKGRGKGIEDDIRKTLKALSFFS